MELARLGLRSWINLRLRTAGDVAGLLRERCYEALDLRGRPVEPTEYAEYWLVPAERRVCVQEVLRGHD